MKDIISELTRISFQESYVKYSTLSYISKDFQESGLSQKDIPTGRMIYGERRTLVERYYASVNWTYLPDVQKVFKVYEKYLLRLFRTKLKDEYEELIQHLEKDGLRYNRGTIELPSMEISIAIAEVPKITVGHLGDMRRELFRLMDYAEGRKNRETTPAARVTNLRNQGIIPSNIASMMHTIISLRNYAEYQNSELSQDETQVVNGAWKAIREWAIGKGWLTANYCDNK